MDPSLFQTVQEIHRKARSAPTDRFKEGALALVRRLIPFDSALWADAPSSFGLRPEHPIHLENHPWEMMENYFHLIGGNDPLVALADKAPGKSFNLHEHFPREEWVQSTMYREHGQPFGLEQTLSTASPFPSVEATSYISLYRAQTDPPITEAERSAKELITPHLLEAYNTALLRQLSGVSIQEGQGRGFALADRQGLLHQRTSAFPDLLRARFPEWTGPLLPPELQRILLSRSETDLGPIRAEARPLTSGLTLIALETRSPLWRLTKTEHRVARLAARGHSQKSAARILGRSPSTIANHLHRIYAKTGVKNKSELSRLAQGTGAGYQPEEAEAT